MKLAQRRLKGKCQSLHRHIINGIDDEGSHGGPNYSERGQEEYK